ncbi:LysR family transcriptional regulator [Cupriavidus plantarum]|uniref:LysR family transcriptional regulator n=1 Tax=Cupriavidus plantarum TaxID=942865 RepID=UPI001B1A9B0C|nr:LysR substrate-binding domain-containing protein [Cupriavidus plantarum]CAG2127975.1 HTH-type transcriptional regulator DmlR [Cupriavidus plantarum]SMR66847.1 LysR family transcriptional regulator, regulator for bpeEF and oprC [Cupriavidus plantarum]
MERMLQAMEVFTRIVECRNFTRASDLLGIPKASTSLLIQQLEAHLGTRLLHRTTRHVSPTAVGLAYYDHCLRVLDEITNMRARIGAESREARGRLRVEMPGDIARQTMPYIGRFQRDFPAIALHISAPAPTPATGSDMRRDGIDCAVKVGSLDDSSQYSRSVGTYQRITVASPAYLSSRAAPHAFHPVESIVFSDLDLMLEYGLHDAGIVQIWDVAAAPHLASGRLRELSADQRPPALPVQAVFSCRTRESACLRVFVDWLTETLGALNQAIVTRRGGSGDVLPFPATARLTAKAPAPIAHARTI